MGRLSENRAVGDGERELVGCGGDGEEEVRGSPEAENSVVAAKPSEAESVENI